ncbi:EAL domain-containing protein [Ciceribacter sp. L1K23]|uniref:putative bifunctional diguanylate cyclase/phosphodiesterase n=1 Tax=Ciceribacter sp. L1K23 TaxID=2820276 RepID=UPI001B83856B|nr:EAL domain-containing protein [Ciceribacter sp. L1K23]
MLRFIETYGKAWRDPVRRQALADAYVPIVRGFLLPGCAYYVFVTWGHWRDETGRELAILGGISALTALAYWLMRQSVLGRPKVSLGVLEACGVLTNVLMYSNVLAYMLLHFEPSKLIYFVLMAVVFSTSGVTLRGTLFSIVLSIGSLFWFAGGADQETREQFVFIGIATSFAAFGMASLLRKAILKQIEARLAADEMAARAQALARTDMLTALPNRRSMFAELDGLVASGKPLWLGIVDLDGFKSINDVYGHLIGDRLLGAVVERLAEEASKGDILLGRIGGDEFAIIVPGDRPPAEIEALGDAMIGRLALPFQISLLSLSVGASAGFAHFPSMGASGAQLYERADYALYKAKAHRRGRTVLFDSDEDEEMKENVAMERALREHDLNAELYLLLQPQYSLRENAITGFEALARWRCDGLGEVQPDKFIRIAERSGLMRRVTDILFAKGLETLARLPADMSLSFNLSARDLVDRSVAAGLLRMIAARGIAADRVEFEITETAVMADLPLARLILEDLSAAGCRIALDDFGSGYSSFRYIDQLPLNKVKVDKSFVRQVAHSVTSREIVAGVIALCQRLGLRSVLEGVETDAELAVVLPLEPDLIQGYYFGRPMTADEAVAVAATQGVRNADNRSASAATV